MRFDQDFIEKVIDANNLVEIISQYTELKARGDRHMGLCPFPDHNEKTGSFSVSESKQLYHCFGCKKSGNIITFLEDYNGFSFVESVEYLAGRAHIEIPQPKDGDFKKRGPSRDSKNIMTKANKYAAVFYHQNLKKLSSQHKLQAYLKKRNLTEDMVEEFRIGYASDNWDDLVQFFEQKKVPLAVAEKLGLIRKNKKGGYFDMFRDRLMFPIFAIDASVIGFGGRIIDQGQPKYINSVESDVFKKGKSFYGLEQTNRHIRSEDRVFVVEGYMDLLALYSRGVKNVVATLGTALTEDHVRLLKRWTKNIVLLFDGDQAGQSASQRSLIHFFKHDLLPQVFVLPEGKDPDDMISEVGRDEFVKLSEKSEDLFFTLLSGHFKEFRGHPKDKIEIIDKVSPLIKALSDRRLQQMYIEEIARRMSEEPRKVFQWIMGQNKSEKPLTRVVEEKRPVQTSKVSLKGVAEDELVLLGLSLKSLKYMDFFVGHQGLEALSSDELKNLFSTVVARYGQEPQNFDKLAHLVVSQVRNPEKIVNLINISSPEEDSDRDENLLKECFIRVKDRFLQRKASELVVEMKSDQSADKLEQFVNIQNERKALKELKNTPLGE